MKTLGFVDSYSQKVNNMIYQQQLPKEGQEVASRKHPLNRINLRSNQLKGNIILGNYGVRWRQMSYIIFSCSNLMTHTHSRT